MNIINERYKKGCTTEPDTTSLANYLSGCNREVATWQKKRLLYEVLALGT